MKGKDEGKKQDNKRGRKERVGGREVVGEERGE